MGVELNSDGLAVQYGPRDKGGPQTASYETDGAIKEIVLDVDATSLNKSLAATVMGVAYADLPVRTDMFKLPAGSSLVAMFTQVSIPFVGGTFVAQLVSGAGAAIAGTATPATGATIGAANVAAAAGVETLVDAYMDAKPSAVLTAGAARVTLRYV